jgi:outer membrane receptor protein involved in Fe transport
MKRISVSAMLLAAGLVSIPVGAAENGLLEELVVTAGKRQQTLQDIPLAVTVATADTIAKAKISDILDLQSIVPSLRVTQQQTSTQTNILIRGFGNGANNPGIESSVGVFVDGVYRSRSASQIGDLVDVERVEVLRGPQSTLFGQNASAGVISVVTRKPSFTPGGSVELGLGEYNARSLRAQYTGPISDRVAFSLSGSGNTRDGYFTNLTNGHGINDRNRYDFRGQLLFQANEDFSLRLVGDISRIDEACCGVVNILNGPTGALIGAVGGKLYTGDAFDRKAYLNSNPTNVVGNSGLSLHADWHRGVLTFNSITALRSQSAKFNYDTDFTSADLVPVNRNDQALHTFTQELRVSFDNGGPVTGLLGGYLFRESVKYDNTLAYGAAMRGYATGLVAAATGSASVLNGLEASLGLPAGTFFKAGSGSLINANQDNDSYTLFGQADWKVVDRLTLTAGVAYTKNNKDVQLLQSNSDVFSSLNLVQIGFGGAFQSLTGLAPTPANIGLSAGTLAAARAADAISVRACSATYPPPACNTALGLYPLQFLSPVVPFDNGHSNDGKATYTVRLAYDLANKFKVYGGVSTGFKATSWNLSRDSKPVAPATADRSPFGGYVNPYYGRYGTRYAGPEESTVYELGLKGQWTQWSLNLALFDQEIKGFQSNIFSGTGFNLANAGKVSAKGAEIETLYTPNRNWAFSFAGTFLDPKYDSFVGAEGPNGPTDLSGTSPAGVHPVSLSTAVTYKWEIGQYDGFVRADYQYLSKVQVVENVLEALASREVNTLNASVGVSRNGWDALLWAHNLNDDGYLLSAFPSVAQSGSLSAYPNPPRMWGVTLRKTF